MPHRLTPARHPVELFHDSERVIAERGEPIAVALLAADRLPLARSPKLHRPRGPYCLRGACDGCLARVDGQPNVMTCLRPATGGERIETQNVLGTRGVDLLRASDFLFPSGIDHHRLFAGVRGVSAVVQSFARRVAGLGRLPSEAEPVRGARRSERRVLVIGTGAAGLGAATELGKNALAVDDALTPGGSLAVLDPETALDLVGRARAAGAELRVRTTALGLYREPGDTETRIHALLVGPEGAELVLARAVVLASGEHDPVLAFAGNDLPGVMSARAGLKLLNAGVAPAVRVALVGQGRFARRFLELARGRIDTIELDVASIVRGIGRARLSGIVTRQGRHAAGALLVDGPGAPSFELGAQAGGRVEFDPSRGYRLERDANGKIAEHVYAADGLADGASVARALNASVFD